MEKDQNYNLRCTPERLKLKYKLEERNAQIELLEKYSLFLEEHEYLDTDWREEEPYAIDEFLKTIEQI